MRRSTETPVIVLNRVTGPLDTRRGWLSLKGEWWFGPCGYRVELSSGP